MIKGKAVDAEKDGVDGSRGEDGVEHALEKPGHTFAPVEKIQ